MDPWKPFLLLLQCFCVQKAISQQVVPVQNGCLCPKVPGPQNQFLNLQLPNRNCNCQNVPVTNGLPINLGLPQFANLPNSNRFPMFNNLQSSNPLLGISNLPVSNHWPISKQLPIVNNLPIINNLPIANQNVPVINNLPISNNFPVLNNYLPQNLQIGNRFNNLVNLPAVNSLPVFNNVPANNFLLLNNIPLANNVQVRNNVPAFNSLPLINNLQGITNFPVTNNFVPNLPFGNNAPVTFFNNLQPNAQNGYIQTPNPNNIQLYNTVQQSNNFPLNNANARLTNINLIPGNSLPSLPQNGQINFPVVPPNNLQIPVNQPNNIQFANVPIQNNGIQLPNMVSSQLNVPNAQNNDCGCKPSGLALLVESGPDNLPGNGANNVVSLNGLQLGGLGGLGNLPLFNGLPVIGVQESVVNLNSCNCQN